MNIDKFKQARKAVGLTHEEVADKPEQKKNSK